MDWRCAASFVCSLQNRKNLFFSRKGLLIRFAKFVRIAKGYESDFFGNKSEPSRKGEGLAFFYYYYE